MEESIPGSSEKRVAVVTEGNRGMGFEIFRQLAAKGVIVVLTARDEKRGAEAAEKLRGLGLSDVAFHQLEISDPAGAAQQRCVIPSHIWILHLLKYFSGEEFRQELDGIHNLTKQRLDEISRLFVHDRKNGTLETRGWPTDPLYAAYKVSNALVCAYTRVVVVKESAALRVNCVHPGYIDTGMSDYTGVLTAAEGAAASVAVALAEEGGVTGAYFDREEVVASFL
ncbi:hypothetical protein ACQ4PT_028608 [Festuca glaucescens]